MSVTLNGSNGITFNDGSSQTAAASPLGLKNRIINGDMRIDQRNAGASVTPTDLQYTLDRWQARQNVASKYSVQQSSTAPVGFNNSLLVTSLSAHSLGSTDILYIRQNIEGFNSSDLAWGTANAKTVTLSFWVRSSLTGAFGGALTNSAVDRSYLFSYTISSANTWEYKTVTIAGDTTGTWIGATNGIGLRAIFSLGIGSTYLGTAGAWSGSTLYAPTGSTSVVGTNGATFYITGVQLEQNTTATPFERRLYGQELVNCQRYYVRFDDPGSTGVGAGGQAGRFPMALPSPMRATPTITASGTFNFWNGATTRTGTLVGTYPSGSYTIQTDYTLSSTVTVGEAISMYNQGSGSPVLNVSAEL
jgi:hypothetical protein